MRVWSIQKARDNYRIAQWSEGFFDINEQGRLIAYPHGAVEKGSIDLYDLANSFKEKGLNLPVLVRFTDILKKRIQDLNEAFLRAFKEFDYPGQYTSVYPIKVNQQRRVVESILSSKAQVGLETGSKPELLAVLGVTKTPNSIIICNGYKDREYIRLALIGQKLGYRVFIILEKFSEINLILEEAKKLSLIPVVGIRIRLATKSTGKWKNTAGEKAKFGFSATQVLTIIKKLRAENQLSILQAIHFHLGSQINNISDIQQGMRECARYFVELCKLGVPINTIDVGGGLGIDYEGSRSRSFCSMNYSMQEYANNIVFILGQTCRQNQLKFPHIITESGRAMTAHHALLITNVIAMEPACDVSCLKSPTIKDSAVTQNMWESYTTINEQTALEVYHDICYWMAEIHTLFNLGVIGLQERALAEKIYYATCFKVREYLNPKMRAHREAFDELNEKLADKFFCNFSLFQSLPDAWAIDQVFPILPLTNLDKKPTRRGILHDITCDSDGVVDNYLNAHGLDTTLPLLPFTQQQPYLLGVFLVGAYQEILGDIHNLFGDTDSVHLECNANGYSLTEMCAGDTVEKILGFVNFQPQELLRSYQQQLEKLKLPPVLFEEYLNDLKTGLNGYTYFEE